VVSLGGTDDPHPGAALIAEPLWREPLPPEALPFPPPRTPVAVPLGPTPAPIFQATQPARAAHHDPFAPPDAALEGPLELAAPPRHARTAAVSEPAPGAVAFDRRPYSELADARRSHVRPREIMRKLVVGVAVVVAAVVGWNLWSQKEPPERAVVRQARATIRIDGLPDGAFVFLDGVRTHMNPIELPISGAPHQVRLEAIGYRMRTLVFTPARDQVLDGTMEPEPQSSRAPPKSRSRSHRSGE